MKLSGKFRVGAAIGVGVVAAVGLTGCATDGQLGIFSEEQSAEDIVSVSEGLPNTADADTTRFLWADGDVRYFAALSLDGDPCMIVLDGDPGTSSNACSTALPLMISSGPGAREVMLADELPSSSPDWEKVAEHLWVSK
ncbi:hypothetical protein GY21_19050 [Cryobacterium roopkundense]|uniref:Lipoprotein n=1 Tax=Cryobacterium roopkundense TaxID=1001240 RepID=A0A099J0D1_9MICO|nr:hypothetical protein [Cryobacterium roopkundense]KGJ71894.1 hypothetical protein GY21_19050 [Cryobacterium roopkundense]MBB5643047.1 hypothetical protein [Cryobacterium roopkundense]